MKIQQRSTSGSPPSSWTRFQFSLREILRRSTKFRALRYVQTPETKLNLKDRFQLKRLSKIFKLNRILKEGILNKRPNLCSHSLKSTFLTLSSLTLTLQKYLFMSSTTKTSLELCFKCKGFLRRMCNLCYKSWRSASTFQGLKMLPQLLRNYCGFLQKKMNKE